jgi:peptidoglycan/LPS O-acetylase OafA/YrhL
MYHIAGQVMEKSGHAWATPAWHRPILRLLGNGNRGVELFFVLSGFILGRPFARQHLLGGERVSLRKYYLRRLTRLEPPYLLNLLSIALVLLLWARMSPVYLLKHFAASALYLHGLIYRQASAINGVAWTLELEVQFYALAPLLALLYRIRGVNARRSVLLAAILFFSGFEDWAFRANLWGGGAEILYETVFVFLQYFLAGMLLSDLYATSLPRWPRHIGWDLAGLLCWPAIFLLNADWDFLVLPPLMTVAGLGAFRGVHFPRFFRMEATALIGGMCYSIYLWHFFAIALVFKLSKRVHLGHDLVANMALQAACLLPPILAFSAASYLLVERPCMDPRWPRKLMAWLKRAGATVPGYGPSARTRGKDGEDRL